MKKSGIILVVGIVLLILFYLGLSYNSIMKKDEQVKLKWAEVQSTYQRRLDLIPNLVNVVKAVSEFEAGTLADVIAAREKAQQGIIAAGDASDASIQKQTELQNNVAEAANRVIAVIEQYPTLKGTDAYAALQTQLEGTERRVKIARVDFNESVAAYNVAVRSSTTGIAAKLFGFKPRSAFRADDGADKAIEIKF